MRKIISVSIVILLLMAGIAGAQEERLEARIERSQVSLGNPIYLSVTFYGAKNVPHPDISPIDGLRIKYVGPSTKISVVNGKVSQSVTHNYLVISLTEGDYKIGPFYIDYRGKTYEAGVVSFRASKVPIPSRQAPSAKTKRWSVSHTVTDSQERSYVGDRAFLVMRAEKERMYINEIVPVAVKLYVDQLRLKEIQYPDFTHEGFSAGKFDEPEKIFGVYRGKRYDMMVFRKNIFGIKEGEYVLGPAHLGCKVMVKRQARSSSIFGRSIFNEDFFGLGYQTYPLELASEEIPVTILPFPKKGRPVDFQGAVGNFRMDAEAEPRKVKVGDPIVVRMTISGEGNLDSVTVPRIEAGEEFKTYEPQTTIKAGKKTYEQIIIPKTDEVEYIPGISFSFLNPETGKYQTIKKEKIPIEVLEQPEPEKAVKLVSMPGTERVFYPPEKLGKDIIHIKEHAGRFAPKERLLYRSWTFWAAQAIPLGAFLILYGARRKEEKIRRDKGYARLLKAPRKAREGIKAAKSHLRGEKIGKFYDAVFRTLQEYLADKFNLPIGSVTLQIIDEKFRPAGADESILEMLRDVFLKCDMARYASGVLDKQEAGDVLEKVRRVIDYFEKNKL